MRSRVGQRKPTVVLCNRLASVRQLVAHMGNPTHWMVLAETPESRRIAAYLRSREDLEELDTAGLLRQQRETFRNQYIDFVGALNRNNSSLEWWGLAPTTKNPVTNALCQDVSTFRLIVNLMDQGYRNLLVVSDSNCLAVQVQKWASERGISAKDAIKNCRWWRNILKLYTPAPVAKAFLVTMYRWLSTRRLIPRSLGQDNQVVIVGVTHAASYPADGSNEYRDVYFQPLMEHMAALGRKVLVMAVIRGRLTLELDSIKKLEGEVPVVPVDAFLTLPDILWCLVRSLWRSLAGIRIKGSLKIAGLDVGTMVRRAVAESYRSGDLFMSLRFYRATRRMANIVPVERCIYPFENRTWERMMLVAMQRASPHTRLVGYQHAAITPSHLHFFLGEGEAEVTPLPHALLTAGDFTCQWLEREGGYPPDIVRTACALRHQEMPVSPVQRKRGRVLVAMGNSLDEYVRTLTLLRNAVHGGNKERLDESRVVIRPHPNLTIPLGRAFDQASISGSYLPHIASRQLDQELSETDALIYVSSTVAIEAAYAGIPTVYLDLGQFLDTDPMQGWDDFKWRAECPQTLLKALEEIEELPKDRFEELSHRAHNYACSYLTPVTDQRMNIFLEV